MADTKSLLSPTPTVDELPRRYSDFPTLIDALAYAAKGQRGANFYNARGDLVSTKTWAEIYNESCDLAAKLLSIGFQKEDRIAIIAETSPDFVVFFMACQTAGILPVPMPLPTSFGGKEGYVSQLQNQMNSCRANAIMAPSFMTDFIEQASEGMNLRFAGSFADYQAHTGSRPLPQIDPEDLSYLQYSSGSTRFPHGIAVTHKSLMSNTHGMGYHGVRLQDNDRCVSWLPFYHDMGLVGTLLTCATCQMSVDFIPTEEFARRPLSWIRVMSENQGTISYSPTFGYDICARRIAGKAKSMEGLDLSNWRVAGIGAEMIRPEVLAHFEEIFSPISFDPKAFLPSYGLAECTLGVSFGEVGKGIEIDLMEEAALTGERHLLITGADDDRMRKVVNCGKPLPEYDIEIRDDRRNILSEGIVGHVFVRGVSVMREYYNDPKTTAEVLSKDRWLNTGDMGYMKKGSLYIVGRAKDMIIVNGKNHWPQDIEWAAEQVDTIKTGDVAAISIPGENAEEVPIILVQCRQTDVADRVKLIDAMKKQVQNETGINVIVELVPPKALPRTSSGKLSRVKARNQFLSGQIQAIAS